MKEYAVIADNISKSYKMYRSSKEKFKDLILPGSYGKDFFAISDMSFKIEKGEVIGLLGLNGSGKSTLSNILGGISIPTSGTIEVRGEPAIIAISSGLNAQLTGMENIEIKGLMLGFSKLKIREITDDIVDFADIGEFIYQPVKTYSSGMKARLGFAISVNIDPDILIIDEALSVGDPTFSQKCLDKMTEFKNRGKTIFFVSHSLPQVREFCSRAMWIEYGTLKAYGDIEEVADQYQKFLSQYNKMTKEEKNEYKKNIVENNQHLLLNYSGNNKRGDSHKIVTSGKIIKYAILVKGRKLKKVPYNLDWQILIFSIITALVRKDFRALLICCAIILSAVLVFENPFIGYAVMMLIFSIISGRMYTKYLIKKKGFILKL